MNREEALAELQLTSAELAATAPRLRAEKVRRAYLRRLRECPPERDPEGFRRAREAFEVLRTNKSRATQQGAPQVGVRVGALMLWARRHAAVLARYGRPLPQEDADSTALLATAGELVDLASEADRGAIAAAVELAELGLRRAAVQTGERDEVAVGVLLDLLLVLLRASALTEARRVGVLADEWLATRRAVQLGAEGERWIYTWELLALPAEFSPVVRRALAEVLLAREPDGVVRVFKRHRVRVDWHVVLLLEHAPLLYEVQQAVAADDWARFRGIEIAVVVLVIAAVALARSWFGG